jgi:uncharacterized protein (DUF885 family)
VKHSLPLVALLLASACTRADAPQPAAAAAEPLPAAAVPPPPSAEQEDARLTAFLDQAFDEMVALSPQTQTGLGLKTNYDRLDDYSDADRLRNLELRRRHLADLKARFDPARLSAEGRLSYRLFEEQARRAEEGFRWRWHSFPATNNGSPMGSIPVFLINQHRIDNVADAEAYVARLRDTERALGEIAGNIRTQTTMGITPPAFNFAPVRADAQRVLDGAPFKAGKDTPVFADFKTKVGKLEVPQPEKDRLIAAASEALTGPYRRGYQGMLTTLDAVEKQGQGNRGAWSLPDGAAYYAQRLSTQTTTDLNADQITRSASNRSPAFTARWR